MKLKPSLWRLLLILLLTNPLFAQQENAGIPSIGIWDKFEYTVTNDKKYTDPYREVTLHINLESPEGRSIDFWGFYDGRNNWKIRFSPNELGKWKYKIWFSDDHVIHEGVFRCVQSDIPGRVTTDIFNPYWLGVASGKRTLFRSFHVGDCFFAKNWDDPFDQKDGNKRTIFLNWLKEQDYNMLSIASHYLNRNEVGRGEGWKTPQLWPLEVKEYQKMEAILDELSKRKIVVFPFAGFFGAKANWPTNYKDQELYIKYTLARIGFYWNTILSVAGPEPFWRKHKNQYKGQMKWSDINRLGVLIKRLDVHHHILTIHNEKRASQYGDPFVNQDWYDMSTMQGPTTTNRDKLYEGLLLNHHIAKPLYAQETLWYGNKWHPVYSDTDLRKNALTILFAGGILNFADMEGNSSTGFSGTVNFEKLHPQKHEIVHQAWDIFESIPFTKLKPRQDLVKNGFCLAKEGEQYYVYLDTIGDLELFVDYNYGFKTEWINALNPEEVISGPSITKTTVLSSPKHGEDWILHAFAQKPKEIANGNFPDLALDRKENLHIVYNRQGLRYKKYDASLQKWLEEETPGCNCKNVKRSEPDIVVDSQGFPIVFCGTEAARWNGNEWVKSNPEVRRDTELAIDSKDNVFLSHRKGNNGGFIGLKMLPANTNEWITLTDPDKKHKGANDHVYPDIFIDKKDIIHLVQRHGSEVEVTYRNSEDGGKHWQEATPISNDRSEAPHITVNQAGEIFISTGKGYIFKSEANTWDSVGRMLPTHSRMQPEFGIDQEDNLYLTAFGGYLNIKNISGWLGLQQLEPATLKGSIGFLETIGAENFAYILWEEGQGNANEGLEENASIIIGKIYPDGRVIGF
ncbi:MAG: DUF5060 domain-containing protein [Bacteroidota bacterium]